MPPSMPTLQPSHQGIPMGRATLGLQGVLRTLLMQARGLGDTSLRYEELGGGWAPSSEGAEAAPTPLQRPAPSSPTRQGSRFGPWVESWLTPGPRSLFPVSQGQCAHYRNTLVPRRHTAVSCPTTPALNLTHPGTQFLPHPICGVTSPLGSQE